MRKLPRFSIDSDLLAIIVFSVLIALMGLSQAHAAVKPKGPPKRIVSPGVRTVRLTSEMIAPIRIIPGRSTVLSFPTRPSNVILGNQGGFAVEYVENDIAIAALSARASSDLFVYLEGRRFTFNLVTASGGGDTIVLVRDATDGDGK